VAALAGLSGGLHLDGLADTADGLARRAGAERALEIMRRSDIGPFGVVALILTLLVDVAALACLPGNHWRFVAAMAVAAATGRLAATLAGLPGVPPAREAGFGALVTGTVSRAVAAPVAVSVLAISGVLGALTTGHAAHGAVGWPAAVAVALALGWTLRVRLTRALGGITGDVFGALIEVTTTLTLLGLALVR
jgi:adenosylcobinamide-GDP ribazoletransferase